MTEHAQYNSQEKPLLFRAYGRLVEEMVKKISEAESPEKKKLLAQTTIALMKTRLEEKRKTASLEKKLWDHLAFMTGYDDEIGSPFEVVKHETLQPKPLAIPYSSSSMRFRHYGRLMQKSIDKMMSLPTEEARMAMCRTLAFRMQKCLNERQAGHADIETVAHEIAIYTEGLFTPSAEELRIYTGRKYTSRQRR